MVNLQKSGDSAVKFVFTDSDHYLYGNGEIEVPVNSLLLVIDESDMVTFKKLSGDPFLSFRADNSNLGTKAAIEQFYKDNMVGSTGGGSESGITSGEVQTMIDNSLEDYYTDDEVDAALSGKASVSDVTAIASDVSTLSGQVATKVAITDFNAYSAATDSRIAEDEEVTAAALNNLNENKQGKLAYYEESTEDGYADIYITNDDGEGNVNEYSFNVGAGSVDLGHYNQYDYGQYSGYSDTSIQFANPVINIYAEYEENGETETTTLTVYPTGVTINNEAVATEPYVDAATSGKADTSAVTAAIDAAVSGKVDTSAITTAITSGSTDNEIPTAKATYDAIQAGGGGSVTVDPTLDTGSTNPVANSAITTAMNAKAELSNTITDVRVYDSLYGRSLQKKVGNGGYSPVLYYGLINGANIVDSSRYAIPNFQLVEKSAITSAMTSSSTDAQVPSAKAVYDQLGGLKFVKLTQSEYSAMEQAGTLDANTIYFVTNVVS